LGKVRCREEEAFEKVIRRFRQMDQDGDNM